VKGTEGFYSSSLIPTLIVTWNSHLSFFDQSPFLMTSTSPGCAGFWRRASTPPELHRKLFGDVPNTFRDFISAGHDKAPLIHKRCQQLVVINIIDLTAATDYQVKSLPQANQVVTQSKLARPPYTTEDGPFTTHLRGYLSCTGKCTLTRFN